MLNLLLGNRQGMTIIGPATVVKEIKKDPNNIELLTIDGKNKGHVTTTKTNIKKNRRERIRR
jgi:hypothetical protein